MVPLRESSHYIGECKVHQKQQSPAKAAEREGWIAGTSKDVNVCPGGTLVIALTVDQSHALNISSPPLKQQ